MSRRDILVLLVLTVLALVPVTLSFLRSGDQKSASPISRTSEGQVVPVEEEEPGPVPADKPRLSRSGVPVFKSFEDRRYQQFDALLVRLVAAFNRNAAIWVGGTAVQGESVPKLTAAQVKAHMIQETGGRDLRSRTAWTKDPLQVNVPGDWTPYKKYLGLRKPRRRNEGSLEKNLKAGIMLLARKGFGASGQPAANRSEGAFDGWKPALQRYNGRSDATANGCLYREVYADRILKRAGSPAREIPIEIPLKTAGSRKRR